MSHCGDGGLKIGKWRVKIGESGMSDSLAAATIKQVDCESLEVAERLPVPPERREATIKRVDGESLRRRHGSRLSP